jgi:peptidoglycan/LPS O-acetylase OafA/YrhL
MITESVPVFPHETPSTFRQQNHLPYLDALRGLAALGVILVHSSLVTLSAKGILNDLTFSGQRGVQLFYVVSAFTLCHSFDVRLQQEAHPLGNYFIRRFFRIAPLFYVAAAGNFLINGFGPTPAAPYGVTPFHLLLGLTFLFGFHWNTINSIALGGWSIAVETSFYLVLPLVLSVVNTAGRALCLLIIGGILAPALSLLCIHLMPGERSHEYFQFLWFPIEFPVFCLGIFAYYVNKEYVSKYLVRHAKLFSFLLILGAALIFLTSLPITNKKLYWSSLAFLPLIFGLSLYEWKIFVNPITVFMGKISYSLYLMHFFCLFAIRLVWLHVRHIKLPGYDPEDTLGGFVVVFISILLFSIVLSTLTYYIIEKPGIRLGRNLIQKREKAHISARI